MRGLVALAVLAVAGVAAQGTVLQAALPGGITPDLAFALTLVASRLAGAAGGSLLGFWSGLLTGASMGGLSLPMGAVYAAVGSLAGIYFESTAWVSPLEVACLVTALSLWIVAAEAVLLAWLGVPYLQAGPTILPATAWNVIILTPLLAFTRGNRR